MRHKAWIAIAVLISLVCLAASPSGYDLLIQVPMSGVGSWDYLMVGDASRRIYFSHESQVQILDADTHEMVGSIPDTPGFHGIEFGRCFINAGTANAIIVSV